MGRKDFPDGTRIQVVRVSPYVLARMVQIINPSFETGDFSGWEADAGYEITAEEAKDGTYSVYIPKGTYPGRLRQYVSVLSDRVSELRFWWLTDVDVEAVIVVDIFYTDGTYTRGEFKGSLIKVWDQFAVKPDPGKTIQLIEFYPKTVDDWGWLDMVELILAVTPTRVQDVSAVATRKPFELTFPAAGDQAVWTPATGKRIRLKLLQYSTDADVEVGLRFGTTETKWAVLQAKGVMALNLVGCNLEGATDEKLNVRAEGAVVVKGFVVGEEL